LNPEKRFANAEKMLTALLAAVPKNIRTTIVVKSGEHKIFDWRKMRRGAFLKRYRKVLSPVCGCCECGEPIAESMLVCPYCRTERNRFDATTQFSHVCQRCHKGVWPEWKYCPWCYGPGFASPSTVHTKGARYHMICKHCKGKLMRFMRYCPWCRRKIRRSWQVRPFPEIGTQCNWSVDTTFWNYCPWCGQRLIE
jgi:hypothetical protein